MNIRSHLEYFIVTFNRPNQLSKQICNIVKMIEEEKITILDNSSSSIVKQNRLFVNNHFPKVKHIDMVTSDRFSAYNRAIELSEEKWMAFRSDDDQFFEEVLNDITLSDNSDVDLITFDYKYDGYERIGKTPKRPICTYLFKSNILKQIGPMGTTPGSDWKYFQKLDDHTYKRLHIDLFIMNKAPH